MISQHAYQEPKKKDTHRSPSQLPPHTSATANQVAPLRVLISGASVAGPALAYWLSCTGSKVTIVERAHALRREGQGVDVHDTARDVIRLMGIFNTCREKSSKEEGLRVVDSQNNILASFPVDLESGKGNSATCDIEILKVELAGILYDLTEKDVSNTFGDMVESLKERDDEVRVHFANGTPSKTFDLVVATDVLAQRSRAWLLGDAPLRSDL